MTHPLKQRFNQLTGHELDDLASVLGAVLHETGRHAKWLLSEEGRQIEDWSDEDAVTTARIRCSPRSSGSTRRPKTR